MTMASAIDRSSIGVDVGLVSPMIMISPMIEEMGAIIGLSTP